MQHYVYVVFSSTPNRMGSLIRKLTRNRCNHVGITLDPTMDPIYSFARRYYRTPLYGGFVQESNSRYQLDGKQAYIHVSRIPITPEQAKSLSDQLSRMYQQQDRFLYNHLSALGALVRQTVPVKDAYTCVEFCVKILWQLGLPVTPGAFYSVDDLDELLRDYRIYEGPMPITPQADDGFYAQKPVPHPNLATLRDIFRLLPRLGK